MHVQVLGGLQGSNPAWYGQLTGHLTEVCVRFLGHVVIVLLAFLFFVQRIDVGNSLDLRDL